MKAKHKWKRKALTSIERCKHCDVGRWDASETACVAKLWELAEQWRRELKGYPIQSLARDVGATCANELEELL
jgi:hypothetical protein